MINKTLKWLSIAFLVCAAAAFGAKTYDNWKYKREAVALVAENVADIATRLASNTGIEESCRLGLTIRAQKHTMLEDNETVRSLVILANDKATVYAKYETAVVEADGQLFARTRYIDSLAVLQELYRALDKTCGGVK